MQIHAFPFYSSKNQQFRFDPRSEGFQDWNLYTAPNRFLPFMIKKITDKQLIDCIKIFSLANEEDPIQILQPETINYKMYSDKFFDYIFYYAAIVTGLNLPCGKYYLQIGTFYSEVFTVVKTAELAKMLEVNWRHESNIGDLIYQNGFFQRVFLKTHVLEPKYKIEQEGDEDGYNNFIQTFSRTIKQLNVEAGLLPEFLIDALALLPSHNRVNIGQYVNVKEIEINPDWLHIGVFGNIKLTFTEENAIVSKTCAEPLILEEVDQAGYVPKSWLCGVETVEPYWKATGETECVQEEYNEVILEDFDFLVVRYTWPNSSGTDLDTKTGFVNTGTAQDDDYVGFGHGAADTGYLKFAGDQTGEGVEAIMIDFAKFVADYPATPAVLQISLQAHWWGAKGTGDIIVNLTTYKGGAMQYDEAGKNYINVGGVEVANESRPKNINVQDKGTVNYTIVGLLEYTKETNSAKILIE